MITNNPDDYLLFQQSYEQFYNQIPLKFQDQELSKPRTRSLLFLDHQFEPFNEHWSIEVLYPRSIIKFLDYKPQQLIDFPKSTRLDRFIVLVNGQIQWVDNRLAKRLWDLDLIEIKECCNLGSVCYNNQYYHLVLK